MAFDVICEHSCGGCLSGACRELYGPVTSDLGHCDCRGPGKSLQPRDRVTLWFYVNRRKPRQSSGCVEKKLGSIWNGFLKKQANPCVTLPVAVCTRLGLF